MKRSILVKRDRMPRTQLSYVLNDKRVKPVQCLLRSVVVDTRFYGLHQKYRIIVIGICGECIHILHGSLALESGHDLLAFFIQNGVEHLIAR